MKRYLSLLLMTLLLLTALSACGNRKEPPEPVAIPTVTGLPAEPQVPRGAESEAYPASEKPKGDAPEAYPAPASPSPPTPYPDPTDSLPPTAYPEPTSDG